MKNYLFCIFVLLNGTPIFVKAAPLLSAPRDLITYKEVEEVLPPVAGVRSSPTRSARECSLIVGMDKICKRAWDDNTKKFFTDVSALPGLSNGSNLKLGIARYQMIFGENLSLPFSFLASDVTGDSNDEKENELKLLDPEQGLNFAFEQAWDFRIGRVCENGPRFNGSCVLLARAGGRYLQLDEVGESSSTGIWGGFLDFRAHTEFEILKFDNVSGTWLEGAGKLRLTAGFSAFSHNGNSSDIFFTGITDNSGNALQFENNYASSTAIVEFTLSNMISLKYEHFSPHGIEGIEDQDSISINFDLMKF